MTDADLQALKKISDTIRLGQSEVLSQIIHAGLESINTVGSIRVELPLKFQTLTHKDTTRWQETEPPKVSTRR